MSGGASAAVAIDAPNMQLTMISDAYQARVGLFFALTGITCPKSWSATDDWFEKSTQGSAQLTTHVTNRRIPPVHVYSFGTHDAIDAERIELHWLPNELHHHRLRLQV